jgi:hypothetical protein
MRTATKLPSSIEYFVDTLKSEEKTVFRKWKRSSKDQRIKGSKGWKYLASRNEHVVYQAVWKVLAATAATFCTAWNLNPCLVHGIVVHARAADVVLYNVMDEQYSVSKFVLLTRGKS